MRVKQSLRHAAASASRSWRGVRASSPRRPTVQPATQKARARSCCRSRREKRLQHFPSRIVEEHDDGTALVLAGVRDLLTGHLKCAVADQHERPPSCGDLHPQRGRNRKSHGGVVRRRHDFVGADVDAREHRVAGIRNDRHVGMRFQKLVDNRNHVPDFDRFILRERFEHFGRQLIGGVRRVVNTGPVVDSPQPVEGPDARAECSGTDGDR